MAIHVVTDSTSDLTASLEREAGVPDAVHVVPLTVHFGGEEFRDGVDLTAADFYHKLQTTEVMPRTSQPSPATFLDVYESISQPGDVILSYHISSRLSGTYQSATLAARRLNDRTIDVLDTRSASLGLGLIALAAARAAREGKEREAILAESREMIAGGRILFLIDTLEYLQKNGRIGTAQALVGGLLSVKPILTIEDGVVAPVEKVRGKTKSRNRLLTRIRESASADKVHSGAVIHAAAKDEAESMRDELLQVFGDAPFYIAELGPTVGTHTGPGALGVVTFVR